MCAAGPSSPALLRHGSQVRVLPRSPYCNENTMAALQRRPLFIMWMGCGPGPGFYVPPVSDPDKPSKAQLPQSPSRSGLTEITPNVPARLLLGPAVKNNWFTAPFLPAPSPKPIPHNWSIEITLPFASFTFPTNFPSAALKALIVPWSVLFEINSVLLSIPKFLGATAIPQG